MRVTSIAVGVLVAAVVAACGTTRSSSTARKTARALPSPFVVLARFSDKSLGLNDPRGLALGSDGNVYLTDLSQRVTVISPAGKVLRRWGTPGSGPGEFQFVSAPNDPTDLHSWLSVGPSGDVYVADSGNNRVQVFTPRGRFMRQFGSSGTGKGQFVSLFSVVVDRAGNVYTTEGSAARLGVVTKFSPAGKVVWQIGGVASSNADLTVPIEPLSMDPHGRLVTINDNGLVLYIDSDGHELDSFDGVGGVFPSPPPVCGVTVDPLGYTYVTGCGQGPSCMACGATLVFDRTHRLVAEWTGAHDSLDRSPVFGSHGAVFALGRDGSVLRLRVMRPGE
jgi:DNA-binding beta-propeller fold protein YncE